MCLQPLGCRHKVFCGFLLVQGGKQGAGLVFIAGVAAQRGQRIRGQHQITFQRQTTGNVFNVRIQPPVFMHHQNGGQLALHSGRAHQITFDGAIARRRRQLNHCSGNPLVVFGYLLGRSKVGTESGQQAGGCQTAYRELLGFFQKPPAIHDAVHIGIKKNQQFLVEILGSFARHGSSLEKIAA